MSRRFKIIDRTDNSVCLEIYVTAGEGTADVQQYLVRTGFYTAEWIYGSAAAPARLLVIEDVLA